MRGCHAPLIGTIGSGRLKLTSRYILLHSAQQSFNNNKILAVMSSTHVAEVSSVVNNSTFRSEESGKQLTFVLGGQYIVSTTVFAKPLLVWETETSYPRYYIPVMTLHEGIDRDNRGGPASVVPVEGVNGKDGNLHAMIESLTVGSKRTTWARFVEGPLEGYIRFDLSELGKIPFAAFP